MALDQQLADWIARYVAGVCTLEELRRWRRAHVQAMADHPDPATTALYGTLVNLLTEFSAGERTESSLRQELAAERTPPRAAQRTGSRDPSSLAETSAYFVRLSLPATWTPKRRGGRSPTGLQRRIGCAGEECRHLQPHR
jgi:hypothetical protein